MTGLMSNRENTIRIMKFDNPQKVLTGPPLYGLTYFGCNHQGFDHPEGHECPVGTVWKDIWGTEWHKEQKGVMGFPRGNPIDRVEKLKDYKWPDPDDERLIEMIYKRAANASNRGDSFIAGQHRDTLWEKAYMLVGMENMMEYFFTEPEFVREVLHRIMDFQLGMARHYAANGVEFAILGDDLGTQTSLILSPSIINEFLVPEYRRLFNFYREKDIFIIFHSCGHVEPLLEMFIDLGVDILNPVQATANDLRKVREITRGRMSLQGGVSSHIVLEGPVERIKKEVEEKIRLLGSEGGYFCYWDQWLDYPQEHIDAFEEAVELYGKYPL